MLRADKPRVTRPRPSDRRGGQGLIWQGPRDRTCDVQLPAIVNPRPVAVIDDDIRFIRLIERVLALEGVGIQPITTLDLDEAVRIVGESHCQAALIDVYMYGDALGFRLIEKLRSAGATAALPLIVTSGARREIGRKVAFLQQQRCSVLLKPFKPEELLAKLPLARPAEQIVESVPARGGLSMLNNGAMNAAPGGG